MKVKSGEAASASVGLVLSADKGAPGKTGEGSVASADLVEAVAGDRRLATHALGIDGGSAASTSALDGSSAAPGSAIDGGSTASGSAIDGGSTASGSAIDGGSTASGSASDRGSAAPASTIDRDPAAPTLAPAAHGELDPTIPRAVHIRATQAAADSALFFALAPAAVFLAAGYSESLFAAFAFSAWAAARRDRWGLAVGLAAGASAVRVNGLFLAAAIALEFVLAGRSRRRWRQAPLLAVPVVPVAGYVAYLRYETGDWFAWQHAQAAGWFRTFRDPKYAWDQTWRAAFGASQAGHTAWVFQLELVAVLVGLALTALLLLKRRWPEALYVALSLLALGTSTWFMSVPRTMLLWWPLWTMLGAWAARRPMVRTLYVCCVAPVMVGVALLFLSGQWAG